MRNQSMSGGDGLIVHEELLGALAHCTVMV
jgi:hypothetical protein